jgi:hypothetical protein
MAGSTGTTGVIIAALITAGGAVAAAWIERADSSDAQPAQSAADISVPTPAPSEFSPAPAPPAPPAAAPAAFGVAAQTGEASGPGVSGDGRNRTLSIVNETGRPLWRIKATRKGVANFGTHDWLGKGAIPAGQSASVDFDDGSSACLFDMRFEFATGEPVNRMGVDVCKASEVKVADG